MFLVLRPTILFKTLSMPHQHAPKELSYKTQVLNLRP